MTETLSSKLFEQSGYELLHKESVKQFIKDLKDKAIEFEDTGRFYLEIEQIDKLAGEDLI